MCAPHGAWMFWERSRRARLPRRSPLLLAVIAAGSTGVRTGDHPRGHTNGGALARARGWRPAALAALAAVAALLASGAERDSRPPQGSETAAAIAALPGVEQVEPLGGKLYPPRYDTLDYKLNQLVARHEGRDAAPGTPATVAGSVIDVVVRLDPAYAQEVAAYLREQGAGVAEPSPGADYLAVAVPLSALADLAGRPGVHLVKAEPTIQRSSEGIAPHGADFWHEPGWQGGNGNDIDNTNDAANIRIGIIDTGFVGYSQAVTSGHVPTPKETLCYYRPVDPQNPQDPPTAAHTTTTSIDTCDSQTGWSEDSHGTWVTELAYDIAPGADYYLVRIDLASQFKDAITWLMAKDVEVISTSLGRTWEGPGDGTDPYADPEYDRYTDAYPGSWLSQVSRAVDAGIFVAVAAGNAGASSWFGTFLDRDGDNVMEWDGARDECNEVRFASSTNYSIRLRWEDDWNGADDDLEIYLREGTSRGATADMSEDLQSGMAGQDPIETIDLETTSAVSYCLVIERAAGATTEWVQLVIEAEGAVARLEHLTEGYSITSPGETAKAGVLTVGAASVLTPSTIQSTSGRGPLPASSARTVVKPDVVGVDNVRLSTSGNSRVTGTSLATPHVAGLAALVLHRNPGFTPAQIADYLKDNALPRGEPGPNNPGPNNPWGYGLAFLPHIGPVITGKPQVGVTLTANIDAIDDIDTLGISPTFTYQWMRVSSGGSATNISSATSSTYTPVQADAGRTLKVKVSFADHNSNEEEQTSRASLRVAPADRAATGKPTISGTLRVTEIVTASTSSIRDSDGVSGATFEYQWVRVDGGTDTDISGETGSSYVLRAADEGQRVKVKVSFTDNNGNAEMVVSDASAVVGSTPNLPAQFPAATTSREVAETAGEGENIGDPVDATDTDPLAYSIKNDSGLFAIDPHSGQLRTNDALDYETRTSHTVVVQVTDNKDIDGVADTVIDDEISVTVNVLPVDEPPIISGPQTVDWNENRAGTIASFTARDPEGAPVALTLVAGRGTNSFQLSNGRLSFLSTELPNFEGQESYYIELGAIDDPLDVAPDTTYPVTINILDVDEPADISFTKDISNVHVDGNALSVSENYDDDDDDAGLTTFTARDPENAPDLTYEWRLEGTDRGDFVIDKARKLLFAAIPDYDRPADSNRDNTYNVTVAARGSDNKTGRIALTVTVLDVNEPPVIKGPAMVTIEEGATRLLVGTYTATDPEGAPAVWQPTEEIDAEHFTFASSTGRLTLKAIPNYEAPTDFGENNSYDVTLVVQAGDHTVRFKVDVTVTDKDEAGELRLSSQQPVVGRELTATVSDLDGVDSTEGWTWERSTSRGGPWTALITGAAASSYTPAEADLNQYLRVTATYTDGHDTDGHGMGKTLSDTLDRRVGPETDIAEDNRHPEFSGGPRQRSVLESAAPNAPVGAPVIATDADNDALTYSLLDPSGSRYFTIDAHGSTAGQIRVALASASSVTVDHEERAEVVVSVTATDFTGSFDSVDVTITIEDVNEAPEAVPESVLTEEDKPITIDVLANDPDPEGDALTVHIVSRPANGTVNVHQNPGDHPTVTYTPHLNYHGLDGFSYRAQDTGSPPRRSAETTVAVFVAAVNDAPTFLESMPTRLVPDNAKAGDFVGAPVTATDIVEGSRVSYGLSGEDSSKFTIDGGSGQITVGSGVTFDIVMTPIYTVKVKATDRSGASATVEVIITVTEANDPPVAVADTPDSFDEDTTVIIDVLANDSDPEDERSDLRLTVFNSGPNAPSNGTVSVNEPAILGENRTITYDPNTNFNGTDTFTYQVSDSGSPPPGGPSLSSTASVTVQIEPVNDAPTYALDAVTFEVSEGSEPGDEVGYALTATDVDGDTLTYSLTGSADFGINPVTGQITTVNFLDAFVMSTYTLTVTATDNATPATIEVTITVVVGEAASVDPPTQGGGVPGGGGGVPGGGGGVPGGGGGVPGGGGGVPGGGGGVPGGGGGVPGGGGGGGGGGPSGPSPSEADFEWTVKRDIEELDSGNDWPTGLWSDGATLWLLENGQGADDDVYAYDPRTGERLEEREFELADTNRAPRGIWSDGVTVWVSDSGRDRVFAYTLASGARAESREIELAERNSDARGIWSDGETMWVLDGSRNALFAYDLTIGDLLGEYALASANSDPRDLWSDGTTVWVSDHGAKRLFAYRLPAGPEAPPAEDAEATPLAQVRDEEFSELTGASNNSPRGIWSDGDVMYVADESDDKVYTYNMPDAIDARLASLSLSGIDIGEFSSGTTQYEGAPAEGVTETTVEASALQRRTRVVIDPPDADEAAAGHQIALDGISAITVTVTSADETRTKVYRVNLALPPAELAFTPVWTAIEWPGVDGVAIAEAGLPDAVVAVYVWDEESRTWLSYFSGLGDVPGLNTLTTLTTGKTYSIAVSEPVTWTVETAGGGPPGRVVTP